MDETIKRKLNILIYLAKVDGKFHKAEKALIADFVKENNLNPDEFKQLLASDDVPIVENITDKAELMYMALKVIKADNVLAESEMNYCRELAQKLGFNNKIVDELASKKLTRQVFETELLKWKWPN